MSSFKITAVKSLLKKEFWNIKPRFYMSPEYS